MKKLLCVILSVCIAISILMCNFVYVYADNDVNVIINGNLVEFSDDDAKPVIYNNRVYVPIRKTCEYLDIYVQYDANESRMYFIDDLHVVSHIMGTSTVYVYGEPVNFDTPSINLNGRTLMPIRMLAESLGATVSWDDDTRTVSIIRSKLVDNYTNNSSENNIEHYQYTEPIPEYSENQYQQDLDLYTYRRIAESDAINNVLKNMQPPANVEYGEIPNGEGFFP